MRRLRAWTTRSTHSGGAGAPPGTTTGPCEELADVRAGNGTHESAARRRKENAAMERRVASAPIARRAAPRGVETNGAPHGAPFPRPCAEGKRDKGAPGAFQTTRAI